MHYFQFTNVISKTYINILYSYFILSYLIQRKTDKRKQGQTDGSLLTIGSLSVVRSLHRIYNSEKSPDLRKYGNIKDQG